MEVCQLFCTLSYGGGGASSCRPRVRHPGRLLTSQKFANACVAVGFERELGYFSLTEIEGVRGKLGLPVERDLYFEKKPLSQCR